jgi:glycine betaine/choline ABC-type transport system substrate-binding protein
VSARLTTDELVQLNKEVDLDGLTPRQAARNWLVRQGLGEK